MKNSILVPLVLAALPLAALGAESAVPAYVARPVSVPRFHICPTAGQRKNGL